MHAAFIKALFHWLLIQCLVKMPLLDMPTFQLFLLIASVAILALHVILLIRIKRSGESKGRSTSKKEIPKSLSIEPRVIDQIDSKHREKRDVPEGVEHVNRTIAKSASTISKQTRGSGCPYHFGYLSKRPKNAAIPSECLTCNRLMECSLGVSGSEALNRKREG